MVVLKRVDYKDVKLIYQTDHLSREFVHRRTEHRSVTYRRVIDRTAFGSQMHPLAQSQE